ncbi:MULTISPECIES: tRNA lysidine(34) synthetase TilS [unclassified Beijerinckia]|uniref:tRNA lysidine(34) synthetase TilS n=1 Tax=unclassified Beijerinckia TaxID=2638183 RepID=UPI001FCDB51D|nr:MULTISPECIES: tRNA lysidine(34) synthetase TilS [unclassified Beijerinckia]
MRSAEDAPDPQQVFAPFAAHGRILIAVSGGPDSMALLWLARQWSRSGGGAVVAATVDHGLRPEAAEEAATVAAWCQGAGIDHTILRWDGPYPKTRIQERAREARYRLLAEEARRHDAAAIATAHHADDQAETILFRLFGGSGVAGLRGIQAVSATDGLTGGLPVLRPLLDWTKPALEKLCSDNGLPFSRDPSNDDPRYARVRLRQLSGQLAAQGLGATELARLARRMAGAQDVIDWAVETQRTQLVRTPLQDARGEGQRLDFAPFAALPVMLVAAILRAEIAAVTGNDGALRLDRLEAAAAAISVALTQHQAWQGTLGGAVLKLDKTGRLEMRREPSRRRGR